MIYFEDITRLRFLEEKVGEMRRRVCLHCSPGINERSGGKPPCIKAKIPSKSCCFKRVIIIMEGKILLDLYPECAYWKSICEVVKLLNKHLFQQFRVSYQIHWSAPQIVAIMSQKAMVTMYGDHTYSELNHFFLPTHFSILLCQLHIELQWILYS